MHPLALPSLVVGVDPDSQHTAIAWAELTQVRDGGARDDVDALLFGGEQPTRAVYKLAGIEGGGTGSRPVAWSRIGGVLEWLGVRRGREAARLWNPAGGTTHHPVAVLIAIESQPPTSPRSEDVESLRQVRYHWDAACDLVPATSCVHVLPSTWMPWFVAPASPRGEGAMKREYQRKAKAITNGRARNEDQCAAVGLLAWAVDSISGELTL